MKLKKNVLSAYDGEKRVLAPVVFDTLKLVAGMFGGIGGGVWFSGGGVDCPVCAHGIAIFATDHSNAVDSSLNPISAALQAVGISTYANDDAVRDLRITGQASKNGRVSFARWAKALNVVRGEE